MISGRTARIEAQGEQGRGSFWVLLIGVASGVLYGAVYLLQRAIYLNGLRIESAGVVHTGYPADRAALVMQGAGYYGATAALFALYVWLLYLYRGGALRTRRARTLALIFPVLFNIGLLIGRPYLSIDIFSYMAHGYLGTLPGGSPYLQPALDVEMTQLGPRIVPWGWRPVHGLSPYGPLWTLFEIAVMRVTGEIAPAMLLMKALVTAASLLSGALIWSILGRVRPADQLLGTLLYLWNPMIVVEFAGEGHNDALMIVWVLLALLLTLRQRAVFAIPALALGMLTKYLPLLLLPAQLLYLWRTAPDRRRLIPGLVLGFVVAGALAILLYWLVWIGPDTFTGVRESGRPRFLASTSAPIFRYFERSRGAEAAAQITSRLLGSIFGLYLLVTTWRARDADSLVRVAGGIALVYMLVASPGYWPWYASMPVALLALTPRGAAGFMAIFLGFCSRLVAPIDAMVANGFGTWEQEVWLTTAVGVTLPLIVYLLLNAWYWRRRGQARQMSATRA